MSDHTTSPVLVSIHDRLMPAVRDHPRIDLEAIDRHGYSPARFSASEARLRSRATFRLNSSQELAVHHDREFSTTQRFAVILCHAA